MSAPRLEINLDKLQHNANILVERLGTRGITVTAVTKAFLGNPVIAAALLGAGVSSLGDSRIENIKTLHSANVEASMSLIRSPMPSQIDQVVAFTDVSFNTELEVIRMLSSAAVKADKFHGIVLMVELGDLREGILPVDLKNIVPEVLRLPNIQLKGIGANLACRCGVAPDISNMSELSALADYIEDCFELKLEIVSGGNSGNLAWALSDTDTGRINDLRLGESILLGCETLHRDPIEGLYTDAITLVAEVIESKRKPSKPWGTLLQNAFGEQHVAIDRGDIYQTILAIGQQDIDPDGLQPPEGIEILGASSDHLIVDAGKRLLPGSEIRFTPNYSALVRAMTSPYVLKQFL